MKKINLGLGFVLIIPLFLSGCLNINLKSKDINKVNNKQVESLNSNTDKKLDSYISSIDNIWNLYTNDKYGFSMKIPKNIYGSAGCVLVDPKTSNSYGPYDVKFGSLPVKLFEEDLTSSIYISTEYFYGLTDKKEIKENNGAVHTEYNGCKKFENNINLINNTEDSGIFLYNKALRIDLASNIKNDTDLENLIKKEYGSDCKLKGKEKDQKGLYNVEIETTGPEDGNCFINYVMFMKYYEPKGIVIYGNIGQELVFCESEKYEKCYEFDIVDSIKFVE